MKDRSQVGMYVLQAMKARRSVRSYTDDPIDQDILKSVVEAGLVSAAGRGIRPWELVVVQNRETLDALSECRTAGSQMLKGAAAAIVVVAYAEAADTWIEDSSIVMANMHVTADAMGLGSCWIQGRMRYADETTTTRDYVANLLDLPDGYELEAILSLGVPATHAPAREIDDALLAKVHYEKF